MFLILQFLITANGNNYFFTIYISHPQMLMKMALGKQMPNLPLVLLEPPKWLAENIHT